MSKKFKEFSLLSKRQQARRVKSMLAKQMESNKEFKSNVIFNKSIVSNVSNSSSPSIIRIVPSYSNNNKIVNNVTNPVKTVKLSKPNIVKVQTMPSTSAVQHRDHEYMSKNVVRSVPNAKEELQDLQDFEDISSDDIMPSNFVLCPEVQISNSHNCTRSIDNNIVTVPNKVTKSHSEQCCCSCRDTLDIILKQQQEILSYLRKDNRLESKKLDLLPTMPFNDINDFLDFDESLTNENVQDQFVYKLKKLLVPVEQKSVSNIMLSIMTNELCRSISWIGIKDTIAFGNTNMVQMIIELLQDHHQTDIDSVRSRIAEWLRRCGDRIGNEIKKNKRRMKAGHAT